MTWITSLIAGSSAEKSPRLARRTTRGEDILLLPFEISLPAPSVFSLHQGKLSEISQ